MSEDGEQDTIHGGDVLKGAHRAGAPSDFTESPLDGIGGSNGLSLIEGFVAETGEEIVEVTAQAGDGGGILVGEAVGELSGSTTRGREIGCVHDVVESALDGRLVSPSDGVEDIADLVSPATLNGDVGKDGWEGSDEALAAIDADHLEALADEAAVEQIGKKASLGGAFACRQTEIDDLLLVIRPQAQCDQYGPPERARTGLT